MTRISPLLSLPLSLLLSLLLLSTPALLAACGDNQPATLDAGGINGPGGPTADAGPGGGGTASRAVVVVGDFMPGDFGVLSTIDPVTHFIHMDAGPTGAVGSDPVLRHIGNELLIINRGDNNVTILDDQTLAFKEQLGTGAGSFAQDVAVTGDKLYVAATGTKGVVVLTRGSTATATIDLSADDPDGFPDCDSVYLVGTRLFVACGLLSNFVATGPGKVYLVDTTTDTLIAGATVTLTHNNPLGWFERFPDGGPDAGDLMIPTVDFHNGDGCVERVTTGAPAASAGCLVDNSTLGGYAVRTDVEVDGGGQIVWTAVGFVSDIDHGNLVGFDMSRNALSPAPINSAAEKITDVVHCPSGQLVAFDSTAGAPGVRVYDGGTETTPKVLRVSSVLQGLPQHGLVCY